MTRTTTNPRRRHTSPGITLIETIAMVTVMGLIVPPSISILSESTATTTDALTLTRAVNLSSTVLEHVIADVSSTATGLGFSALDDPALYLDEPDLGLRDRIAPSTDPYTQVALTYSLTVSKLVDQTATVNTDPNLNVFRVLTVNVTAPTSTGPAITIQTSTMVTSLQ